MALSLTKLQLASLLINAKYASISGPNYDNS